MIGFKHEWGIFVKMRFILAILAMTTPTSAFKRDLAQYLSASTPEAAEMLSTGPAGGVVAIEKTMKEGFWKFAKPLQVLQYESIVVRMVGKIPVVLERFSTIRPLICDRDKTALTESVFPIGSALRQNMGVYVCFQNRPVF